MTTPAPPAPAPRKPVTRRQLEAQIIAKAWRDPAYKERLVNDPKGVLQSELKAIDPSIKLPDTLKVQTHEENPDLFHLVLPRNPAEISVGEMVGDNLEAVAPQTIAVVVVLAAAAAVAVTAAAAANVGAAANAGVTANAAVNFNAVA
ncbi:MAG: NHLP leader peptide family RiPP precursor [Rhodospirillaceae bacterium]